MLSANVRVIAPAGYVRAVFSKRMRGHVFPVDLVRRHLGAVNRGEFRRRLAREFSGYLVVDHADDEIEAGVSKLLLANADLFGGRLHCSPRAVLVAI